MEYQEKKVKLITYIDHKSDLGGNAPPKNLAFFKCGWEFRIVGGGESPPPLNTPEAKKKYVCFRFPDPT